MADDVKGQQHTWAAVERLLLWAPRVLALSVALFIGVFALDEVGVGWMPFLIHAAPALVLLVALALSWRWEWIGALVYMAFATYFARTLALHPNRVLLVSGPLFLTGLLFLLSWRRRREPQT